MLGRGGTGWPVKQGQMDLSRAPGGRLRSGGVRHHPRIVRARTNTVRHDRDHLPCGRCRVFGPTGRSHHRRRLGATGRGRSGNGRVPDDHECGRAGRRPRIRVEPRGQHGPDPRGLDRRGRDDRDAPDRPPRHPCRRDGQARARGLPPHGHGPDERADGRRHDRARTRVRARRQGRRSRRRSGRADMARRPTISRAAGRGRPGPGRRLLAGRRHGAVRVLLLGMRRPGRAGAGRFEAQRGGATSAASTEPSADANRRCRRSSTPPAPRRRRSS